MYFLKVRRGGFDTETTGPYPEDARIVTAALVLRGGHNQASETRTWLINPGVAIPDEAAAIHGITTEQAVAQGRDPKTALEEIASLLAGALNAGVPIVAFNLSFDWSVLHAELIRHGLAPMCERLTATHPALIDPHVIDKHVDRHRRGTGMRKLKPTAEHYGVRITDWHTAEADALAALYIAEAQFQQFAWLNALGPAGLHGAQQAWRAEQQAGLQEWFRTKATAEQGGAPDKVIDGSWPLLRLPVAVAS
ncbi:exonuclease domain-containing protein [Kitasatospora sp. NPDC101157]|uniref:exonuclease domain-containing protein n=1 Tax=Kitasatospora sp. NPDC101157 TaxID=3364098 RepID=UPI0037F1F216